MTCRKCGVKVEGGIEELRDHWVRIHPVEWLAIEEWLGDVSETKDVARRM